jgi:hypothetical protein
VGPAVELDTILLSDETEASGAEDVTEATLLVVSEDGKAGEPGARDEVALALDTSGNDGAGEG